MSAEPLPPFWSHYRTVFGAALVWGLLCAFGDPRASDWPPYAPWLPGARPLLEIPLVVGAWVALATLLFVLARALPRLHRLLRRR